MKRSLVLFCLMLLGSPIVRAQSSDAQKTSGYLNGRWWESLKPEWKLSYLNGFAEGVVFFSNSYASTLTDKQEVEKLNKSGRLYIVTSVQFKDIMQQIDSFYTDRANIRVPVGDAYLYALTRIRGGSPSNLEAMAARFRAMWSK